MRENLQIAHIHTRITGPVVTFSSKLLTHSKKNVYQVPISMSEYCYILYTFECLYSQLHFNALIDAREKKLVITLCDDFVTFS